MWISIQKVPKNIIESVPIQNNGSQNLQYSKMDITQPLSQPTGK